MPETNLPQSLKLAPTTEQIFKRPDYHAQYLLPLLSFELSDVFDDMSGPIHFIDPIEPYDGCIGEFTKEFHSYYCRENWISFKVVDGLYECEAPEDYFSKSYWKMHDVPDRIHESVREGWKDAVDEFYITRTAKCGNWREGLSDDLNANLAHHGIRPDNFGGRPCNANWVSTDFPLSSDIEEVADPDLPDSFHYPLTEDGRRFRYMGFMESFDWRCAIHLFYDPIEQRALQTFDWT